MQYLRGLYDKDISDPDGQIFTRGVLDNTNKSFP